MTQCVVVSLCSGIAENDEVTAVEDFMDVGNILGTYWVALSVKGGWLSIKTEKTGKATEMENPSA